MSSERDTEVETGLDPTIHPLPRLRICALLQPVVKEEFAVLRDQLEVSDSALSKQIAALTSAGYVEQLHATRAGRRRVWLRLTPAGRAAFSRHVAALRAIAHP
ncbi:transcriptional regulator [Cryobacterium sp. W22_MBD10_FK3]|uniref:transcriptional regulator n=1 Tax=Cryobacterium sp. W22_MBD10_FK3 TaxID=3240273 RepID=UPI003F8E892E